MKNYFSFHLSGTKLLVVWLAFLISFCAMYGIMYWNLTTMHFGQTPGIGVYLPSILAYLILYAFIFYLNKMMIENVAYKDEMIQFEGQFMNFVGRILLGCLLIPITLGIYTPWFIRNIHSFFVENSQYKSENFTFNGKGGRLFLIMTLAIFVPIILLVVYTATFMGDAMQSSETFSSAIVQLIFTFVIMVASIFIYKWMLDITIKGYTISLDVNFGEAFIKVLIEFLLISVTLGIYTPLAYMKLYAYFTSQTSAEKDNDALTFGYNIEPMNDFLFLWGQTLLIIFTIGIYFPWGICNIYKRIIGKTYTEKLTLAPIEA